MIENIILGILIIFNIAISHKLIFNFIQLCIKFVISNLQMVTATLLFGFVAYLLLLKIYKYMKNFFSHLKLSIGKYGYFPVLSSILSLSIATYTLFCKSFLWTTIFFVICLVCNIKKEHLVNFIILLRQLGIKEINTPWLNLKIEEMEQIIEKLKNDKPSAFASSTNHKIPIKDDDTDLQLDILEISINIEQKIRKIAQLYSIRTKRIGLMRILNTLAREHKISNDINALVRDFWPIRNEIVHQDYDIYISEESYRRMMELGIQILSLLDFELKLNLKQQSVNS